MDPNSKGDDKKILTKGRLKGAVRLVGSVESQDKSSWLQALDLVPKLPFRALCATKPGAFIVGSASWRRVSTAIGEVFVEEIGIVVGHFGSGSRGVVV